MIRTYNNVPISVKTPSSDDIKNYFFNHVNWKGVNEDKNVLAIDQETFQDAKNVYMDTDAVLKSRPSIKKENIIDVATLVGKDYFISDVWTYGNVVVYVMYRTSPSTYCLVFVNNGEIYKSYIYNWTEAPKGVLADNKIFVFTPDYLYYYDITNNTWHLTDDKDNKIYIPVTKVIVNGVESSAATVDSPNELTESYIIRYLYDNFNVATFDDVIGEQVTIKVDGKLYPITFVKNNQLVFVGKAFSLNEFNIADDYVYGDGGKGIPYVQTSSVGNYILSSYSYTLDDDKIPHGQWSIYHSVDGKIFNLLPLLEDVICPPILSENGAFVIAFKDDGPYIYSVLASEGADGSLKRKYQTWTNLLQDINPTQYSAWVKEGFHLNEHSSRPVVYNNTVAINGYFEDNTLFAFCYGANPSIYTNSIDIFNAYDNDPLYGSYYVIMSTGNALRRYKLFGGQDKTYSLDTSRQVDNISFTVADEITIRPASYTYYSTKGIAHLGFNNVKFTRGSNQIQLQIEYTFRANNYILYSKSFNRTVIGTTTGTWHFNLFTISINYSTATVTIDYRNGSNVTNNKISCFVPDSGQNIGTTDIANTYLLTRQTPLIKMRQIPEYIDKKGNIKATRYSTIVFAIVDNLTSSLIGNCNYIYHIEYNDTIDKYEKLLEMPLVFYKSTSIRNDVIINIDNYKFVYRIYDATANTYDIVETTFKLKTDYTLDSYSNKIVKKNIEYNENDTLYWGLKYTSLSGYLLTESELFTSIDNEIISVPLLFDAFPLKSYYAGNRTDALYLATTEGVYSSNFTGQLEIDKLIKGDTKLFVPDVDSQLDNYYFSKNNSLYISKLVDSEDFKWYFPKINTQVFDDNITNLHPIAEDTMAIFFTDSVYRCLWDSDVSAYHYYKTRIQVGCRKGSDVLTTFDGKYTMFASDRGLVAMSYQNFIASTEQSLTYVSDTIYQRFLKFSDNTGVKLYKYSYWIFAYKLDTKECYVYDIRNNSWWPFELQHNPTKFVTIDNEVKLLSKGNMHRFDTSDTKYYDYDGKTQAKIEWFILSQKLHLNALNNYKHIVNMTFVSLHDERILAQGNYIDDNQRDFDFKLQTAIYRKRLDSNIDSENDYVSVNYEIEVIRTFVQRLNFSKVCEFQYKLSYDPENAIEIPLSLNSITVKYKVGGQVR